MKAAGVNLVRTGIWTGWRRYAPEAGHVDEAALRALDVFLLTARQHGIRSSSRSSRSCPRPGARETRTSILAPWLPQQSFLAAVARRYAATNDVIWDLINEPSFSSAAQLWRTRPNATPPSRRMAGLAARALRGCGRDFRAAALRAWGAAPTRARRCRLSTISPTESPRDRPTAQGGRLQAVLAGPVHDWVRQIRTRFGPTATRAARHRGPGRGRPE